MYGCESWTRKKAEHWRIDAFELWCWSRLLWVPLDCKEIQPVYPKEVSPECSLEELMLKLKLQYFGHLMWRADLFEKTLMLGKIEGRREGDNRGWDDWMALPTQWTWVWVNSGSWWCTGRPGVLQSMESQRVRHDWATEPNWAELMSDFLLIALHWCWPCSELDTVTFFRYINWNSKKLYNLIKF